MSAATRVTQVSADADDESLAVTVTVTRGVLSWQAEPAANDVPKDIRDALAKWLGVETP